MRNGRLRQGRRGAAEFTATIIAPHTTRCLGGRGAAAQEGMERVGGGLSETQVRPRTVSHSPRSQARIREERRRNNAREINDDKCEANTRIILFSGR